MAGVGDVPLGVPATLPSKGVLSREVYEPVACIVVHARMKEGVRLVHEEQEIRETHTRPDRPSPQARKTAQQPANSNAQQSKKKKTADAQAPRPPRPGRPNGLESLGYPHRRTVTEIQTANDTNKDPVKTLENVELKVADREKEEHFA